MELRLYREAPILRETRHLPAEVYNLARLLLAHSGRPCAFVPIRSMQYLAVIDQEEIVFVDRERPYLVQIAWQGFRRRERNALDERVEFDVAFYTADSLGIMARLMSEFPPAMRSMADKDRIEEPAAVLPFPRRRR
ncbi:MAG: hypothetical protein AB1591_11895 [Pseudomonadota bacterium]